MIRVTRFNGKELYVNALLIETVESTPDTLITLTTGKKFMVLENVSDVIDLVRDYVSHVGSRLVDANRHRSEGSSC